MKLTWKHCPCDHPKCDRWYPVELGTFAEGTGFTSEERALLNKTFRKAELFDIFSKEFLQLLEQ